VGACCTAQHSTLSSVLSLCRKPDEPQSWDEQDLLDDALKDLATTKYARDNGVTSEDLRMLYYAKVRAAAAPQGARVHSTKLKARCDVLWLCQHSMHG
jgi:hypothetical protein